MAAVTLFLALVLLLAAMHKAMQRDRLGVAAARLLGLSAPAAMMALVLAGVLEAIAALAILIPQTMIGGLTGAALIWALYAAALLGRRGEVLDCGCDFAAREKPIGIPAILRPALLALLALACAFSPAGVWTVEAPFAAAALLALWFAASELAALPVPARSHRKARQ